MRWACGPWLVKDLIECGVGKKNIDVLIPGCVEKYNENFSVEIFETVHNVPNCAFIFEIGGEKLFYATDCNTLEGIECQNADLYMVEANYRENDILQRIADKKEKGEYIYEFDVMKNHLSEEKALEWICENAGAKSEYILMHKHEEK